MRWKLRDDPHLDQFRDGMLIHPLAPIYTVPLLSPAEAKAIVSYITGGEFTRHRSTVYNTDGTMREDTFFRDCHSYAWEAIAPYATMLRHRTNEMVQLAGEYYGLPPITEAIPLDPFQILDYGPGGKFKAHADSHMFDAASNSWTVANKNRKLSFVLALCDQSDNPQGPHEFSGGGLNFTNVINEQGEIYHLKPKAGVAVVFPSTPPAMHEVVPVIKGRRISVVNWFDYR